MEHYSWAASYLNQYMALFDQAHFQSFICNSKSNWPNHIFLLKSNTTVQRTYAGSLLIKCILISIPDHYWYKIMSSAAMCYKFLLVLTVWLSPLVRLLQNNLSYAWLSGCNNTNILDAPKLFMFCKVSPRDSLFWIKMTQCVWYDSVNNFCSRS